MTCSHAPDFPWWSMTLMTGQLPSPAITFLPEALFAPSKRLLLSLSFFLSIHLSSSFILFLLCHELTTLFFFLCFPISLFYSHFPHVSLSTLHLVNPKLKPIKVQNLHLSHVMLEKSPLQILQYISVLACLIPRIAQPLFFF